jgi:pyruvate dehydrogenase E1 component alpha subunit
MHLYNGEVGFHGSVPIVSGTIPIAVGAALAAKLQKKDVIAIAYFGDGACEEGVVHECLNLASVMKLPVLFVVENNLYSSHMDIIQRQPFDSMARFARAHAVDARVVDGNDVLAVAEAAGALIAAARLGEGPGFLEAVTYRWCGHVGANEDIDVGVRRSLTELSSWKKRDPIARLQNALIDDGLYTKVQCAAFHEKIHAMLDRSVQAAKDAPWPEANVLLDYVYSQS